MLKLSAHGPSRAGCHDLPEIDPKVFHRLGGQDITVWGTRYHIQATSQAAIDYVIEALELDTDFDEVTDTEVN